MTPVLPATHMCYVRAVKKTIQDALDIHTILMILYAMKLGYSREQRHKCAKILNALQPQQHRLDGVLCMLPVDVWLVATDIFTHIAP